MALERDYQNLYDRIAALRETMVNRLSADLIANPQLAPYGQAAQELLHTLCVWERVRAQLVLGDNIGQATQFVLSGAAPVGITAYSLTRAPEAASRLQVWPVPPSLHAPLPQRLVLIRGPGRKRRHSGIFCWAPSRDPCGSSTAMPCLPEGSAQAVDAQKHAMGARRPLPMN